MPSNVLFLCSGNSARSILAEALMNHYGAGRLHGFSAGSRPTGSVHPMALERLAEEGHATEGYRSKSWDEFAAADAPRIDIVITVCGSAANETCPIWPGAPLRTHWGAEDPAACSGPKEEARALFRAVYRQLEARIRELAALPLDSLSRDELQAKLDEIGETHL